MHIIGWFAIAALAVILVRALGLYFYGKATMIWELIGKMFVGFGVVVLAAILRGEIEDRRIQFIAWQKRTQAAMTSERARREQAAADREVCAQLELLPASEDSDD